MPEPKQSPLAEALVASMDELISRDPRSLTRQNRDEIVAKLRELRAIFERDQAAGKRVGPAKAPKPVITPEDLGL